MRKRVVAGIDLFCGAGGLTYGLQRAGISVVAGVDLDPACEFPFTSNSARFIRADMRELTERTLSKLYPVGAIRLLAGCAPCRPFSPFRRGAGAGNSSHDEWGLLAEFGRLVKESRPELVTMENVPDLASKRPFRRFVGTLRKLGYNVDSRSVYCPPFGIPQHRRRLVLVASLLGPVEVPTGSRPPEEYRTVRDTIASLPRLSAGEANSSDRLHRARAVDDTNLRRLRASRPARSRRDGTGLKTSARRVTGRRRARAIKASTRGWRGTSHRPRSLRRPTISERVGSGTQSRTALSRCARPRCSKPSHATTSS